MGLDGRRVLQPVLLGRLPQFFQLADQRPTLLRHDGVSIAEGRQLLRRRLGAPLQLVVLDLNCLGFGESLVVLDGQACDVIVLQRREWGW